ncbi:MAG: hypothetical protein CR986_02570 [Ignavibacteriae bacterium]|nr:MAG: hypothetical protein CR986_02570 [Ignavibacteriota bacterium]
MKINAKLFFLAFSVITLISTTSAFIYNILSQELLKSLQAKSIINSANDFIFAYQELSKKLDDDYNDKFRLTGNIKSTNLDFVLSVNDKGLINQEEVKIKDKTKLYFKVKSLSKFLYYNKNLLIRQTEFNNRKIYYGQIIDDIILNDLSQKVRADVALQEGSLITNFSNRTENQYYLPNLNRLTRELERKNNFEIISEELDEIDFTGTHLTLTVPIDVDYKNDFIIFTLFEEANQFESTMTNVTAIIVVTGIFLTSIILLLFTTKYRKQLEYINNVVKNIAKGNLTERVKVITKDEVGKLGNTFNKMLDEIEKRDKGEREYSEFLAMTNKNSSLDEISKAVLESFVNAIKADIGALYLYEDNKKLKNIYSISLNEKKGSIKQESVLYKKARKKNELLEIHFSENNPEIETGITKIRINYLYILPIFYNNQILGIVELGAINKPEINVKEYLNKIKYHLAIGLANGKALSELKILVEELKSINKAYKNQNIKITEKNDELIKLHAELKVKSDELEKQTDKAVESEKLKSQFLANMSHELRTPQNAILGLTELILKDDTTSEKNKERLNVVLRNGRKLLGLIENILEYSKVEAGNIEVKYNQILLSELTKEIGSFVQPLFFEKNVKFILETPRSNEYLLNTDIKKIEQIIFNLVGNAAKFTNKGFVKLKFEVDETNLNIIVEDTGTGIDENDVEIIFDEFRQADGNLNRKFNGTGLGLAICKKYAELLNGTISLNNKYGNGSTFKVSIPNIIIEETAIEIIHDKKLNTLIISENRDSIKLIHDYLTNYEINVRELLPKDFSVDEESLKDIDIVVIDSTHNCWEKLQQIKSNSKLSNIPVIVVNMDEKNNCGLGLNIYDYFASSISSEQIITNIQKLEKQNNSKINKLLFVMDENKYLSIEKDLEKYEINNLNKTIDLKTITPDLIFIDMESEKNKPIEEIVKLQEELSTNYIPKICFFGNDNNLNYKKLNDSFIATTLKYKYHPLDVLKIIKDRIELIDSSIFESDKKIISEQRIENQAKQFNREKNTILIVDDNEDARFTIGEIVQSLNYKPIYAKDGFDCLSKIEESKPDLILLDIMMPKMDGFQTIKKIRNEEGYKNIPVYALTAYAMLADQEIITKNGFDGLFTKPINTTKLERKLHAIFDEIVNG